MDKYGSIDQNWYSSENQKHEREKATEALKQMKELEKQYEKSVQRRQEKVFKNKIMNREILFRGKPIDKNLSIIPDC